MKLAIVGSRGFNKYDIFSNIIESFIERYNITTIVSGGAKGVDTLAEKYADNNKLKKLIIYPDWKTHGKSAGIIRNIEIVKECDYLIAFWDQESKDTRFTINEAYKAEKLLDIINTNIV